MPPRLMDPSDVRLFGWAQDAQPSPDTSRVAWCELAIDMDRDEPVTNIMVAAADGTGEPRRFSDGPHDFFPRWSPDGRYLAFLSASAGPPALHLAPLDGGAPRKIETPGPVRWIEWAPAGDRLVLVANVGGQGAGKTLSGESEPEPRTRNAPRVIRGMFNRLDGEGWLEGRNHLFAYNVNDGAVQRLTSGDYDHAYPSWSPDGTTIVFVSDRSRQRDDRVGWGELWTVTATGGRPRRLVGDIGEAGFPTFSPDGGRVAFTGLLGAEQQAARDQGLFVIGSDGTGTPSQVAPGLDRPVGFTLATKAFAWVSADELVFTVADAGTVGIRRARLGAREARKVSGGDAQVEGIALAPIGRRLLAYTSAWVDSPAEVFCLDLGKPTSAPVQVSNAGEKLRRSVNLLPTERLQVQAPDGLEIEYFVIRPRPGPGRRPHPKPPLFLAIHGGPHLFNPISIEVLFYEVLAAAGYLVVLPNPRGSIGYGESFTKQLRGKWGEADFEDLMACVDDVIERRLADPDRQFVGGYSYGGFMSAWVVGHTDRFKAASVGAPVIDLVSMFGTWDGCAYLADDLAADPWSSPGKLGSLSPLTYAPKVETPVFLYVNEGDLRCPPSQADEFYAALKWHKRDVEFVRYPGGSHLSFFPTVGAPSQCEDRHRRIVEFLGRHGGVRVDQLKASSSPGS